jgi:hypothetical protein
MAEFDSSITAYIGGDYSGLTEAVTGAEGQIKQLDAKFAGLGQNMTKVPQAFAEENKKAMGQILSGEERLAAYRDKTAFSRMTDEEKLSVVRAQGMVLLERIGAIEGQTVEKTALQLDLEKKKTEIFDLNNKVTTAGLSAQKESTAETETHKEKATGLAGVVESLKKGFKDMGISIQGAGIGVAFAAFISLGKEAIANAQKQRDEYEAMAKPIEVNTAALARFGDAIDAIKKGAVATAGTVIATLARMGQDMGEFYNRLRGITEEQEKNAEQAERAADAQQKRALLARGEATDVDKLRAANVALNEATKAYNESKMSGTQKHNALLADAMELTRKVAAFEEMGLDPVKFKTELLEKQKEIRASNIALIQAEGAKELASIEAAGILDQTFEQKMTTMKRERIVLEEQLRKTIEATGAKSAETGAVEIAIQENLKRQLSEQFDLIKRQGEARAKATLDGREYERLLILQLKAATGLTFQENEELKILAMKTKERELSVQIEETLGKRRTQTGAEVSVVEERALVALIAQRDAVTKAIADKAGLAGVIRNDLLPAEQDVTKQNEAQAALTAAAAVAAQKKAMAAKAEADAIAGKSTYKTGSSVGGYGQTFGGGSSSASYQNMSTAALQGLLAKQEAILSSVVNGIMVRNASYTSGDIFAKNAAESQKYNLEKELDLRKEIQEFGKRMGDVATIMKYGDAQTERAFRSFTAGADKTNTILERLSEQLSSTGIFNSA